MASIIEKVNKSFCCVPNCGTNEWKAVDPSITFHEFPTDNPKLASKWIVEINSATVPKSKPMWLPKKKYVICSKHFQPTDFIKDSVLNPNAVPTIFSSSKLVDIEKQVSDFLDSSTKSPAPEIKTKSATTSMGSQAVDLDLDIPLSDLKTSSKNPTTSSSLEIGTKSASSSMDSSAMDFPLKKLLLYRKTKPAHSSKKFLTPCESEVKPNAIKNILHRASVLFARNMAITKHLEDTILPSHTNENECSGDEPTTQSLPKLNLDQALSLAALQTKHRSSNRKLKQKTVLGRPKKVNRSLFKCNSSLIDSAANKTSIDVPKISLSKGSKIQKRKLDVGLDTELIKIGPDKFLKIQRLNAKENTPSTNTVMNPVLNETSANSQSEDDDVAMDYSNADDPYDSSSDYEPPASVMADTLRNAPVNMPTLQTLSEPLNDSTPKLQKQPSVLKNSLLKNVKSTSFRSVFHKPLVNPLNHCSPASKKKLSLKEENALLKKKIEELEKKCSKPIKESSETKVTKEELLKKKIKELKDKIDEQQRELDKPIQNRLKSIHKESNKGNVYATYLLELITGFDNSHRCPKWSDSTLAQCAQLCRKNAFAYELFRKTEFCKLPSFAMVERFMRRNPHLCLTSKAKPGDTSINTGRNVGAPSTSGVVHKKPNTVSPQLQSRMIPSEIRPTTDSSNRETHIQENAEPSESVETTTIPLAVDTSTSELREIVLESGEVVQCYSTEICTGADGYQYYIIPTDSLDGEKNAGVQNSDNNPRLSEQTVDNSSGQLPCSENEVLTAAEIISSIYAH